MTYVALANITLGSSASSVTFSSIPATFRDLVLVVNGTIAVSNVVGARLNGDTGSNYSIVGMRGNGTNTASYTATTTYLPIWYAGDPASGMGILQVMDYSATDKHKTALTREDTHNNATGAIASRWANTGAVTSVNVFANGTTFSTGFTFALYGIQS